uniref:Endothelin converting enzyme 2a n=1 Tax=Neolamprologus brichardi TaxID=32507 RepID=A0A3Q4HI46_NEOBR
MDYLPENNSRYKDVAYWDERYTMEQCYDWLGGFSKFQHILEKFVKKEDSILILGCGNSSMSSDMYSAGYHTIANIDYSSVCIRTMSARYSHCPGMTWHQMDVRQLSFPDSSFDVILEKATLDAIMVNEKTPWEVSSQTACSIHQALTEVFLKNFSFQRFDILWLRFSCYVGLLLSVCGNLRVFVKAHLFSHLVPTENSLPLTTAALVYGTVQPSRGNLLSVTAGFFSNFRKHDNRNKARICK